MIYSHKPQRSGRSIAANTNNPPQDPPPPPKTKLDIIPKVSYEIPDIFIEDSTPPVPEICIKEKLVIATPPPQKIRKHSPRKTMPKQQPQKPKITKPKITKSKITKSQTIKKPQKEILLKTSLFKRFLAKIKSIFGRK